MLTDNFKFRRIWNCIFYIILDAYYEYNIENSLTGILGLLEDGNCSSELDSKSLQGDTVILRWFSKLTFYVIFKADSKFFIYNSVNQTIMKQECKNSFKFIKITNAKCKRIARYLKFMCITFDSTYEIVTFLRLVNLALAVQWRSTKLLNCFLKKIIFQQLKGKKHFVVLFFWR